MLRRREFLATLAAAPAMGAAPAGYEPILAAQAYVFSQAYAKLGQRAEENVREILETIAATGYKNVELTSNYFEGERASGMAQTLMLTRLKCPVIYHGGAMHTAEGAKKATQAILDLAKTMKGANPIQAITLNPDPKPQKEAKTDSELSLQADGINKLAKELKKLSVRLMLHHHDPEMAQEAREWRHLAKNTDPKLVEFCVDAHWIFRGGQDVMTILKEAGTRLGSLHLRNSKNKIWTESLGDGDIDYGAVAAHLKSINYRGYLVVELAWDKETELTKSLEENLRLSREYVEKTFGVKA